MGSSGSVKGWELLNVNVLSGSYGNILTVLSYHLFWMFIFLCFYLNFMFFFINILSFHKFSFLMLSFKSFILKFLCKGLIFIVSLYHKIFLLTCLLLIFNFILLQISFSTFFSSVKCNKCYIHNINISFTTCYI